MNRKKQLQQRGNNPPTQITTVPIQQAENAPVNGTPQASSASSLVFTVVPLAKVPAKYVPSAALAKYQVLEDALRRIPKDQALSVPVPADKDPAKFASNLVNAMRKHLPGTRSRTTKTEIFLWVGEPGPPRAQHSVRGAA